jgi:DNA-binding transcriptional ArsR family regulator
MEQCSRFFRLLSNKNRFKILKYLNENGEATVSDLVKHAGVLKASVSDQLRLLKDLELVSYEKEGLYSNYHLNREKFQASLDRFHNNIAERCDNSVLMKLKNNIWDIELLPLFGVFANECRCELFSYLAKRPYSVNEIVDLFYLEQPTISMHLSVMERAKLVKSEKAGTKRIYSLRG